MMNLVSFTIKQVEVVTQKNNTKATLTKRIQEYIIYVQGISLEAILIEKEYLQRKESWLQNFRNSFSNENYTPIEYPDLVKYKDQQALNSICLQTIANFIKNFRNNYVQLVDMAHFSRVQQRISDVEKIKKFIQKTEEIQTVPTIKRNQRKLMEKGFQPLN